MTDRSARFLPRVTPETERYWQACRNGELLIQWCPACGRWQFYPRVLCAGCGDAGIEWRAASGRGHVETFTLVHVPLSEAYAADVPYLVALVRLAEGPLMMTNLVRCAPDAVYVGMAVEVEFEEWSETVTMPQFRPAKEEHR